MAYPMQALIDAGYTGATGSTPYQSSTAQQVVALQAQYANALNGHALTASALGTVQININFDGTQNNRDFPDTAKGEVMTNVGRLAGLQASVGDPERFANTLYMPGVGAKASVGGSPNNWESTPWQAGEIGNSIINNTYDQLVSRVTAILATDPTAAINLNLAGFSRGGAEAVAFANLLNEKGIPDLYEPGQVPINSMVLFDPVDRSGGGLNVSWPTNLSNPALVFVASAENRIWFPAMPVDTGAIIVPIDAIHSDVGGSFNQDGISAVTLKIARDYLTATGSPMDDIPKDLQPNWDRMYIHNSAIDNYGNKMFDTIGDPLQTVGTDRYYEGSGWGSLTMRDMLGRNIDVVPSYEQRNGSLVLTGFISKTVQTAIDEATGRITETKDSITYARDGKTIVTHTTESVTKNATEQTVSRSSTDYSADGLTILATRSMEWQSNGNLQTTTRDALGNFVSVGEKRTYEDGSTRETIRYADGRTIRTNTDNTSTVTSHANIQMFEEDGSRLETVTYSDGRILKLSYDGDGNLLSQQRIESSAQTLQKAIDQYGGSLLDALTLVKAIQSGHPLPILASGLRVANDLSNLNGATNVNLAGTAYAASGILSLMSLDAALKQGDTLGALTAGAQAVTFGATAYANLAGYSGDKALQAAIDQGEFGAAGSAVGAVNNVLPVLSIVNSLAHGDYVGAAVGTTALALGIPAIGWAYAVYSIVDSLFSSQHIPNPWGTGQFIWNGSGIDIQSAGETGGNEAVQAIMQTTLATLNALIERVREQNSGNLLGLIPNRMPTVGYDTSGYRYTDIDPLTGAEKHPALRFDTAGRPYGADAGSPESYQSIVEGMVRAALSRGAIAPMWEVNTARMQTNLGDPAAGLTEEERAARDGHLAEPVNGSFQVFRPVVLDLDGDGIEVTDKAHGVAFDVDDSGYLKQTAWLNGEDAFLVLDRNTNGSYDSGKELFSNSAVDLSRRGVAGLAWVEANADGRLTAADPVWSELRLWRDLDHDGAQNVGELTDLASQGITELDYSIGAFTQNGRQKQLGSPDLEADKDGSRITVAPSGIVVQSSENGGLSLLVTRAEDKTPIEANRDGVSGYEDIELLIGSETLLANDRVGGVFGQQLTFDSVSNFRHGTGFLDANGYVHFTPEANYAGNGAGFDYVVKADNGQSATAVVDIDLQAVSDAPTATVQRTYRYLYGYTPIVDTGSINQDGQPIMSGGDPIYTPYALANWGFPSIIYDPPPALPGVAYHVTPLAQEDLGSGRIIGSDIDDLATSLTYALLASPQYGAVTLDAGGGYAYTAWARPGEPSSSIDWNYESCANAQHPGTDSFQVKVSDPHGASTTLTVSVPHPGVYVPYLPSGGGGGGCPVAVDLDGDGFAFTPADDSNIFFDINADGWKRQIAWPEAGDGWLAYDANGNSRVDDGTEIAFTKYASTGQTDLQALRDAFDSNHDGQLTAADDKWARFGIWQDADQDGVSDPGEFRSLDALGIASVSLTSNGQFSAQNGTAIHGLARISFKDGRTLDIADVALRFTDRVLARQADGSLAVVTQSPYSPAGEELDGTGGKDLILGKSSSNIIKALTGDDVVFEDGGNDIIDGGDGDDLLYAGADNDLVIGGAGNDTIYAGLGNDVVLGGDGHDALFAEGGNDVVFGGAGNDLISGGGGSDLLSGDDGDDQLYGESGNDALFGGAGNDELSGMDGKDRLDGGTGNDLLDGGAGADEMIGGAGDDTYVTDDHADTVTEQAGGGNDTVRTTLDGYVLGANVENLTLAGTPPLTGYGNALGNVLTGNRGNNTLWGGAGNDLLDGSAGTDTLIGGTGDDTYVVDNAGDCITEAAGEGVDTVKASVSHALAANVEHLILMSTASINGTGNGLDNRLIGNAGDNHLDGRSGADYLAGGRGNDTYEVDQTGDVVVELAGEGGDTVVSHIDYTLGANVENLALTGGANLNGSGNAADNVIVGNAGNNVLDGGAGADTMRGGAGDDTYEVGQAGDVVVELAGEGGDTVVSHIDHTLGANVENLILAGQARRGTGNSADNRIVGNDEDNTLEGASGNDVLLGGGGDDTFVLITGGDENGFDQYDGGAGTNRILGGWSRDVVHVDSTLSNLRNIQTIDGGDGQWRYNTIAATAADDTLDFSKMTVSDFLIDGGAGNDAILGTRGEDHLAGGSGDDFLAGGLGDDWIAAGKGANLIAFNRGDGRDTLVAEAGARDVISLGRGILANDLAFEHVGQDLVLSVGREDSITLQGWFAVSDKRNVVTLQMIEDASFSPLAGQPIAKTFDFQALVDHFEAARASSPTLSRWSLMSTLLDTHIATGIAGALGGERAATYAITGETGLSLLTTQDTLHDAGTSPPSQHPGSRFDSNLANYSIA